MKKLFLFLCAAAFFSAMAADSGTPTLWELVNAPAARKAMPELKSIKMVFLLNGKDIPASLQMIRANRTGQFRIDSLSAEASFAIGGDSKKIWCWDTETGEHKITPEELNELDNDVSLLPIPFMKRDFFQKPVKEKSESVQGIQCDCWKAVDKSGKYTVRIWVDRKDSLLRKVESSDKGEVQITLYEKYKVFNGVEMASRIRKIDHAGNTYTLELQTLQWNLKFAEKIFNMPKKGELLTLEREMRKFISKSPKGSSEEIQKTAPQNVVVLKLEPRQTRRQKLEKRIARLEIEIQGLENRQKNANNSGTVRISAPNHYRSGSWYRRGFRHHGRHSRYSGRRTVKIDWNSRVRQSENEWYNRLLVEKKIELKNAQIDLKNLE